MYIIVKSIFKKYIVFLIVKISFPRPEHNNISKLAIKVTKFILQVYTPKDRKFNNNSISCEQFSFYNLLSNIRLVRLGSWRKISAIFFLLFQISRYNQQLTGFYHLAE